eukprot:1987848-Alexandrium_andersonii.AAC.1
MQEQLRTAGPIARLCGEVVGLQLEHGRHFIQEQPHPSSLYEITPWPSVLRDEHVMSIVYDRCMCGLRVTSGPDRGKHIRKRSSMTASCPELLYPFRDRKCS